MTRDGLVAPGPSRVADLPKPPRWTKDPPPRLAPSPAIESLVAELAGGVDPVAVGARFWAGVERRGTPLVDVVPDADHGAPAPHAARAGAPGTDAPAGERIVTFLWRDRHGVGPGTRGVVLIANKLTDPSLPVESALERVVGTDVWWRAYRLSSAWRGTYVLAADDGPDGDGDRDAPARGRWGAAGGRAERDARNRRTFPGPGGASTLSLLELPDAPPQPWNVLPDGAARGTVEEVRVPGPSGEDERRAWVYVPAVRASVDATPDGGPPDGGPPVDAPPSDAPPVDAGADVPGTDLRDVVPRRLLVLLDGADWLGRRDAPTILDALHHAGAIPPTIALLVDSGVGPARTADLATGDPFLAWLAATLPRWVRERYPVGEGRDHLVLAGESMGGVAVLRAAHRSPELVGAVVAQSASLWWDGQQAADAPSPTVELLRERPPVGVRVHLRVGRDEWILLTSHRTLDRVLTEGGVEHDLVEYEGGHDAVCWRGGLAEGLIAVLGSGPVS